MHKKAVLFVAILFFLAGCEQQSIPLWHKVEKGDDILSISQRYNVSLVDLAKLNPSIFSDEPDFAGRARKSDGSLLYLGDVIFLREPPPARDDGADAVRRDGRSHPKPSPPTPSTSFWVGLCAAAGVVLLIICCIASKRMREHGSWWFESR